MNTVVTVPSIQQQPRAVADSAIHYGYVAFKEIFVGDRWVQPRNTSPYWETLPSRQLIPFTNIEVPEVIMEMTAGTSPIRARVGANDPTVQRVPKSAKACMEELETSYAEWGFKGLHPLTGFKEADAFRIFQTIQPFVYKLRDLENELSNNAPTRIAATLPYTAVYDGQTIDLEPLPEELRAVALKVLPIMQESATRGKNMATEVTAKTKQKMTQFYATGSGKEAADPHDRYVFSELGEEIPSLITSSPNQPQVQYVNAAEDVELKRRELELREKEYELRLREIALKESKPTPAERMAHARAAKQSAKAL